MSEPTEHQLTSIRNKGAESPCDDIKIAGPLAVAIVDSYRESAAKAELLEELTSALEERMKYSGCYAADCKLCQRTRSILAKVRAAK